MSLLHNEGHQSYMITAMACQMARPYSKSVGNDKYIHNGLYSHVSNRTSVYWWSFMYELGSKIYERDDAWVRAYLAFAFIYKNEIR